MDCEDGLIRRSPSLSCIIRPTVGPVRPVVPGDRRRGLLVPSEKPPGHVLAGNSINEPAEIEQAGLPVPRPQATYTPIACYHRVEWVCEAARDAVWSSWRWFCGPQGPRSRRRRGKIRRRLRAPKTLQVVCAGSLEVPDMPPCPVEFSLRRSDGGSTKTARNATERTRTLTQAT